MLNPTPDVGRLDPPTALDANDPRGMAFDGSSMWIANFGDNTVVGPSGVINSGPKQLKSELRILPHKVKDIY